jgi:hypothetical protein
MATIVLSAVGAAVGSSIGGGVLGLSTAVIGRAVGATLGRLIDQRLLGAGSEPVETGKVDRFRIMGASEGTAVARVYGRLRVPAQVIWASRFRERVTTSGGSGKGGAPSAPQVRTSTYSVSLALALCEGKIAGVGRVWADGIELGHSAITLRVYPGDETQLPDPLIAAIEGIERAPYYRGTAYAVIEDLELGPFGNRVPQFSFEVFGTGAGDLGSAEDELAQGTRAVALIPGTGEYALATTPVYMAGPNGRQRAVNVNSLIGRTDFTASVKVMRRELPACDAVSLVVSWFGNDLRCGTCTIHPKVETAGPETASMAWEVSGVTRPTAMQVPRLEDRPVYGGTPTDESVIQAIQHLKAAGKAVMFYPFLLLDQLSGNGRPDPWSDAPEQPPLPWRGRVTTSVAPGRPGTVDLTAAATAEVAQFFGATRVTDIVWSGGRIAADAAADWRYRRFILHYARLCAAAGGVDAFCIGSEMRALTQIRDADGGYPAVSQMRVLLNDVRQILGSSVKLSYAADWSEYFGHHPQDGSGDVVFHLDPLWSDPDTDFVGIDNYMPLSDWRDGDDHADAASRSIYDQAYLRGNVAGGEGFDWYYASAEATAVQDRTPITDGDHGEPWVFRYKDLRAWWQNPHHNRRGGTRSSVPTAWVPQSKPFWFTEYGCPAVDKGTNEPNRFYDPKSSESFLPRSSNGRRDDLIQRSYLDAVRGYWSDAANNPVSAQYGGPMVELDRAFVWAYDARPFPTFPASGRIWSDAENYRRGHWLNGRASARSLAGLVREICAASGVDRVDVSQLYGVVPGYTVNETSTAREALQPLMLAYGFDAFERSGTIVFRTRTARPDGAVDPSLVMAADRVSSDIVHLRATQSEAPSRVRATFVDAEADYAVRSVEAANPGEGSVGVAQTPLSLALTSEDAQSIVDRWLAEARVSADSVKFGLPPSAARLGPGDVVNLSGTTFRIDRAEMADALMIEAVRTDPSVFVPVDRAVPTTDGASFEAPVPVEPIFLDLPLLTDGQVEHAPVVAVAADPWPGTVAVHRSASGDSYELNALVEAPAVVGVTLDDLPSARRDLWDEGAAFRVRLRSGYGGLSSVSRLDVLNGANVAAIGSGTPGAWEVIQFARVELVAPDTYAVAGRLRGLAGSDAGRPAVCPAGSTFVLLTPGMVQLDHPLSLRGLSRFYRIGPSNVALSDPLVIEREAAFDGIGLRPLAPCHLKLLRTPDGVAVTWIRRTRIGGDSWAGYEVPLGEAYEQYQVQVLRGDAVVRQTVVGAPAWLYPTALWVADSLGSPLTLEVAQISEVFGPGPATRMPLNV